MTYNYGCNAEVPVEVPREETVTESVVEIMQTLYEANATLEDIVSYILGAPQNEKRGGLDNEKKSLREKLIIAEEESMRCLEMSKRLSGLIL